MRLWQDSQLAHSLLWGFKQPWPLSHLPFSLLAPSTYSSFRPYIHNPRLLGDDLRVTMNNYARGPYCFSEI